eukprot:TRINITY_DN35185_c0_g1_i1.p1 TRINITY_DN35185_c0_g1~~TRINITY_DN35185_c0_g1_i1.p1  ORF type:complete len:436 (+),score=61.53 TRINITY_DN35185_c0_g1_i1:76-1383(+)
MASNEQFLTANPGGCEKEHVRQQRFDAKDLHMVRGKYYDLSAFVHPGGDLVLRQSVGNDVTVSVASHHFTDAPYRALKKYEVDAKVVTGSISQAQYSFDNDGFFETLKRRVIAQVGLGVCGVRTPPSMKYKVKVASSISAWVLTWVYCSIRPIWWPAMIACCLLRMVMAGIGHESIHGRIPGLWHLFDFILMLPSDHWHFEHCLQHHPECKRLDFDPDETFPACRMNEGTPWERHHVIQVLIESIASLFLGPAMWIDNHLLKGKLVLMSTFVLFATQFAPLVLHPDGFYAGLLVHFAVVMISNLIILHAFHLSHINANNVYTFKEGVDWGEHQLRTTSNWAASWYSITGMLEMQIEHHLFPSLSYELQHQIKPLVKKTAAEFKLPYFEYPSIFHGVAAHCDFMHRLGMGEGKWNEMSTNSRESAKSVACKPTLKS